MATPESKIQTEILKYLKSQKIFCWRQNNLPVYDPKIGGYRAHAGVKGVPDIICIIKGQFVGIEVKTPQGKQSADQKLFQRRCENAQGVYILARSVDDVRHLTQPA